jgi:hypothetical protein
MDRLLACERSAVHLEMRDVYLPSDPRYRAWRQGARESVRDDPQSLPWLAAVREVTARGVEVRRARVVSEPVSDYIRFEHHLTDANVAAGESVRWLPRRAAARMLLPGTDFWVFDGTTLFLHFDGDGELPPDDETEVTDPAVTAACRAAFETVWAAATPHADYRLT